MTTFTDCSLFRPIDADDVLRASGDPRGWFTPQARMTAHVAATNAHHAGDGPEPHDWQPAAILYWGDMGSGTSTLMAHVAAAWFKAGHDFYHDGGFTFGRIMERWHLAQQCQSIRPRSVVALRCADPALVDALLNWECRVLLTRWPGALMREMRERVSEVRITSWAKSRFQSDRPILAYHRLADHPLKDVPADRLRRALAGPYDNVHQITGAAAQEALMLTDSFAPVMPLIRG